MRVNFRNVLFSKLKATLIGCIRFLVNVKKNNRGRKHKVHTIYTQHEITFKRPGSLDFKSKSKFYRYLLFRHKFLFLGLCFLVVSIVSYKVTPVIAKKVIIANVKLTKKDFKADEKISIDVGSLDTSNLKVSLKSYKDGNSIDVPFTRNNNFIEVAFSKEMVPGKFKVMLFENNEEIVVKDFTWGVLAINFNKSIYVKGEKSNIALGVLDDLGMMVCDADVKITIKNKDKNIKEELSTADGSIKINDECYSHDYAEKPDYSSEYEFNEIGKYDIEVKAKTSNGERVISDKIEVKESVDYDVERITSTRLYPEVMYPVILKIKANKSFKGKIKEFVPPNFAVYKLKSEGILDYESLKERPQNNVLYWDVNLKEGDEIRIGYKFDPPDISPELFLLGKLRFTNKNKVIENAITESIDKEIDIDNEDETYTDNNVVKDKETIIFQEERYWMLANDALGGALGTRLWSSGWELGQSATAFEYTANLSTAPVVITAATGPIRSGTYAMRVNLPGSPANSGFSYQYSSANSVDGYYARAYIYVATAPTRDIVLMGFYDSTPSEQTSLRMTSGRQLILWSGEDSVQTGATSAAIPLATWTRVELKEDSTTFPQTRVAGMINGEIFAAGSVNHANGANQLRFGLVATSGTVNGQILFDDMAINNDVALYENWPGEGKVVYARPNGNGTNTGWTGDYTAVDEITPNDVTDFVNCTGTTQLEDYSLDDTSDIGIPLFSEIKVVAGNVRVGASGVAGARTHQLNLIHSGLSVSGGNISINSTAFFTNTGAAPNTPNITAYLRPGGVTTGEAISNTMFDAMQVQLASVTDCNPQVRVSAVWANVEYVPPDGGRVWSSGFETNSTQPGIEWTSVGGTLDLTNTLMRSGTAAFNVGSLGSGTSEFMEYIFTESTANGPYFIRTYLNVATTPSAENRLFALLAGGSAYREYITIDNNRNLRLYDEDGQVGSTSPQISLGTWYRLESIFANSSAGAADTIEAMLDGTVFASSTSRDLSTGVDRLRLGGNLNLETQTAGSWFFDDVAINQNAGSTQNTYPGPGNIVHLLPIANGITFAWATSPGGCNASSGAWECINDRTPNDATDLITSSTLYQSQEALLNTGASVIAVGSTINILGLNARLSMSATQNSAINLYIKESTTNPIFLARSMHASNGTWFTNTSEPGRIPPYLYTRPGQYSNWGIDNLNTLNIGIKVGADGGTGTIRTSALWSLVEYLAPVGTNITVSGFVYSTIGAATAPSLCDGSTNNIALRASSTTYTTTCNASTGLYQFTSVAQPAADAGMVGWIDGNATDGAMVVRYDGVGNSTENVIYTNTVTLHTDQTSPVTNTHMDTYDNGNDTDIPYTVTSNSLTVNSGIVLFVDPTELYSSSGPVVTNATGGDLQIGSSAVATLDTGANVIGRDVIVDTGATFNVNATLSINGGDITGNGVIQYSTSTPTVTLTGSGLFGGNSNWTFYNLFLGGSNSASTSANGSGTIIINKGVTVSGNHILIAGSKTWSIIGSGTPFVVLPNGFIPQTSTISYGGTSNTTITNLNYYNLENSPATGSPIHQFQAGSIGGASWYDNSWIYRKSISIGESMIPGGTNLTDYPLLINLSTDTNLQANAQTDGDDILFTSSNGTTKLDHEIEKYNSSNGSLQAFVRIPTLTAATDTTIYMYYGNSTTSNQQNPTGVWDSNYIGVWHLSETSGTQFDSTSYNQDLTTIGVSIQGSSSGFIGGADWFSGTQPNFLRATTHPIIKSTSSAFFIESWLNADSVNLTDCNSIANGTRSGAGFEPGYFELCSGSGLTWTDGVQAGATDIFPTGQWIYTAGGFSGATHAVYYYQNLTIQAIGTNPGLNAGTAFQLGFVIGGSLNTPSSEPWVGRIDEVRLSNIMRPDNWRITTYNNTSAPNSFISVGSQSSNIGASVTVNNNYLTTGAGSVNVDAETNDPIIDVNNNFTIASGDTFQASSTSPFTIAGTFTNSGIFVAGSGTITFDDSSKTSQIIHSGITFYNFTSITPAKALQFDEADRTTIANNINIGGTDCTTNRIFLDSVVDNNQWDINVLGTGKTFNYVDVEDSNAITALTANDSTAVNNNNTNWTINAGACGGGNQTPTAPSNLIQIKDSTGTVIAVGNWINTTTVRIGATASDPDASDTLYLCAEVDALGVSFSNTEDACGAGSAYSGSPISINVTIPNLNSGTEYHWQARVRDAASAYSPWVSYGGNAESARDFGVDTVAPTGGTVYDGTAPAVDAVFNSGSLSVIGANWTGFDSSLSGLLQYEYSVGTAPSEASLVSWTNANTGLSVNVTGLTLQTSLVYYFNVRAIDNAGNTSPVISSDGQLVLPTLSFSVSPTSVSFSNLNASNSYSDTQPVTLTTSTNAYNGYVIRAFITALLTGANGTSTIQNFNGGSYASPDGWQSGDRGFGYNSNDTLVQGANIFNNNPCPGGNGSFCYAPFTTNRPGDIVADHTANVTGSPISNEAFTVTYRVTTDSTQPAMPYSTTVVYSITAIY